MKVMLFSIFSVVLLTSCKKDDTSLFNPDVKADLSVEFDNIAGSSDLQLNTGAYTNASGETFTVTKLKYYVSNFTLTKTDGTVYTVPQDSSYFLLDESDGTEHAPVLHVPEGEYKTVSFVVGVDSLRRKASVDMRTGVLDTATNNDMYWDENSGYIFFNMEGTSPVAATAGNVFQYHIGGYSSPINNIKKITLDLTARGVPQVKEGKETNIHLMVDVLKVFDGTTSVSIASNPVVMYDAFSTVIADNYVSMFRHDHTEN